MSAFTHIEREGERRGGEYVRIAAYRQPDRVGLGRVS